MCKNIVFLVLLVFLVGCRNKGHQTLQIKIGNEVVGYSTANLKKMDTSIVRKISFMENGMQHFADEIFSKTQVVPLETTKESLISKVRKLIYHDDKIYIWDSGNNGEHGIVVFDLEGKHLFSIRDIGKGPGEYIGIRAFNVDETGNIYIVNAGTNKQMIKYSSTGDYLKTIDLDRPVYNFVVFNDKIYGFNGSNQYFEKRYKDGFVILNAQGKYIKGFIQYDTPLKITPPAPVFVHNNQVYLNPPYSSTLYSLTKTDELKVEYELESVINKKNVFVEDEFKKVYLFTNALLALAGNHLYVYSAKAGHKIEMRYNNMRSNYEKGILANHLFGKSDVMKDSILITALHAHIFKTLNLQYDEFRGHAPKALVKLTENLDEGDNPVLVFNTLKKAI